MDERTVPQALLELRTLVEWHLGGQRAVAAKEAPREPLSPGHLSWMLAEAARAHSAGDSARSARYQGHVEGVLTALGVPVGLVAEDPELPSLQPEDPRLILPFSEQEQRVWAAVYGACLAHGACQNVVVAPLKAAGKAYEAVLALRALPHGASWRFPDGWAPPGGRY